MIIPEGWEVRHLSDVVQIQRGFDLPHHARRPGPYPVLTSGDTGGWHDEGPVQGPGVTIGRATNLGQPKWSKGNFWPHNTTMFVKDFKGNYPRWVFHVFENTDLAGYDSGSVQPMLNRNYIAKVPVLVPPVRDQVAISEVLGALDDKVAANANVIQAAEQLMVARASTASEMTQVSVLARQSTASVKPEAFDEVVAHYSLPAFDEDTRPQMTPGASIKSNKFILSRPSVLMSKLNPRIPRVWNVPTIPDNMALSSTEFVVLQPAGIDVSVLWSVLAHPSVSAGFAGNVAGTSGSHQRVKPAELMSTQVRDPRSLPAEVQASIATLGLLVGGQREESAKLAEIRDALLPQLMSGKITVKDAEGVVERAV